MPCLQSSWGKGRIVRWLEGTSTGLKSRDKAAMLYDKQYKFLVECARKKTKFSSQAREKHQLLSTNMAAVTSATNQQYGQKIIRFQTEMAWYLHVNKENDFRKIDTCGEDHIFNKANFAWWYIRKDSWNTAHY